MIPIIRRLQCLQEWGGGAEKEHWIGWRVAFHGRNLSCLALLLHNTLRVCLLCRMISVCIVCISDVVCSPDIPSGSFKHRGATQNKGVSSRQSSWL